MKRLVGVKRYEGILKALKETSKYASAKWPYIKEDADTAIECLEDVVEALKRGE